MKIYKSSKKHKTFEKQKNSKFQFFNIFTFSQLSQTHKNSKFTNSQLGGFWRDTKSRFRTPEYPQTQKNPRSVTLNKYPKRDTKYCHFQKTHFFRNFHPLSKLSTQQTPLWRTRNFATHTRKRNFQSFHIFQKFHKITFSLSHSQNKTFTLSKIKNKKFIKL